MTKSHQTLALNDKDVSPSGGRTWDSQGLASAHMSAQQEQLISKRFSDDLITPQGSVPINMQSKSAAME
jgi:hypothetical protein